MQHLQIIGEKSRLLFKIQPQQTMSFQRQTFGAQTIIHRFTISIRQKFTEMFAAYRTLHIISPIKWSYQDTEEITEFYQYLTRKYFCQKRNQLFHYQFLFNVSEYKVTIVSVILDHAYFFFSSLIFSSKTPFL